MEIYNIITLIIVLTAIFGYINHRFIKLPRTIGIMLISLITSLAVVGIGIISPEFFETTTQAISLIDFQTVLLKVLLSFLLFAAAIHVDSKKLQAELTPIITFASISVIISTFIIGGLLYFTTVLFGLSVNFLYCLLFGALISPTDPIAVVGILRKAKIPESLETKISGESLLNDGVGVVLFITFYQIAQIGVENISVWKIIWLFVREAGGGLLFGWFLGYIGYLALRSIDNYVVEVMVTLAIVMGGYSLTEIIHVSGPLSMVVAGIITGNKSMDVVASDVTRDYIGKFWELIDEVMNAILFLLIGFEMLIIPFNLTLLFLGCITIVIVLFARLVSVSLPIRFLKYKNSFSKNTIPILTWGALRGGISVALALAVPKYMYGDMFVSITYIVVLFSIIIQGLSIGKFAKKLEETDENSLSEKRSYL
ncbi:MAG: cation:proton antiporter [Ginsengibacter sp.]